MQIPPHTDPSLFGRQFSDDRSIRRSHSLEERLGADQFRRLQSVADWIMSCDECDAMIAMLHEVRAKR